MKKTYSSTALYLLATVIVLGTIFSSCQKGDSPKAPTEVSGVYATYSYGSEINDRIAVLWKDGVETDLTNYTSVGSGKYGKTNMYTSSVAISPQNDVYVSGCECLEYGYSNTGTTLQCYTVLWKNGIKRKVNETNIPQWYINSELTDLQIASNGDVYVLGIEQIDATKTQYAVWKNDNRILTLTGSGNRITGMFVKGDDVYITGNTYDRLLNDYYPVLWKNGVEQKLPISSYMAKSVFVSDNNDVYVGLHNGKVLKNNIEYTLNTATANEIHDIAAAGSDIYVLATYSGFKKAGIWKNGNLLQELEFDKTIDNIEPGSMFIKGEDIYAIGVVNHAGGISGTGLNTVVIWKNGKIYEKLKEIDGLTVEAPSVFVK